MKRGDVTWSPIMDAGQFSSSASLFWSQDGLGYSMNLAPYELTTDDIFHNPAKSTLENELNLVFRDSTFTLESANEWTFSGCN